MSPSDAEGMFDILTYEKGAAVVRMLEQYLGEDEFRDGIRHYLRTHAYANTETTELWDALEEASGEPVRRIMDSWIFQGGFPLISVDLVDDGGTLRLTQHRFGYAGDLGEGDDAPAPADDETTRWSVPAIFSQKTTHDGLVTFERRADRGVVDRRHPGRGRRVGAREHREHRLLPGALRPRPAGRPAHPCPERPLADRALRARRRRVGRRPGRRDRQRRLPRDARRLRRRDRPVGVATHRGLPARPRPPRRRRAAPGLPASRRAR